VLIIYRICIEKYSNSLNGTGLINRWNLADQFVSYSSESISLATLELLVHRNNSILSGSYKILKIQLNILKKDLLIVDLKTIQNFKNINDYQKFGSQWYNDMKYIVLKVPSIVIPQEFNFVINTRHKDFKSKINIIETLDYSFDKRIV
jgi:RES domain-containing protein